MPFDDLQPVEYGWVPPIAEDGRHVGVATGRSHRAVLATEMLRADQHPTWLKETEDLLFRGSKPKFFGTPMDYARMEMAEWRKVMLEYKLIMRLRHILGVERDSLLKDPVLERNRDDGIWTGDLLWYPKTDYNTELFAISENRVRSDEMRGMMTDFFGDDPNRDWDSLPKPMLDLAEIIFEKLARSKGVFTVKMFVWLPWDEEPEQKFAREYNDECEKYQASKAGRKAKRLLLENLTPEQEEDYYRKGYFFVVPRSDLPMHERRVYTIERSYPNGNVRTVRRRRLRNKRTGQTGEFWCPVKNFCYHTQEPHAIDDILLAQKLMLENDEAAFHKEANITDALGKGSIPIDLVKRSV